MPFLIAFRNIIPIEADELAAFVAVAEAPRLNHARKASHPGLELHFSMLETPEQFRVLAEGRIDIALARPRPSNPAQTLCRPVHREGIMLALAASHRLARGA